MMELTKIIAPAHWASYLINGDDSGLDPGEVDKIEDWLSREDAGRAVSCEVEYFTWQLRLHCPEAGAEGGTVAEYTFIKD